MVDIREEDKFTRDDTDDAMITRVQLTRELERLHIELTELRSGELIERCLRVELLFTTK